MAVGGPRAPIHPRFEQLDAVEPREAPDGLVDPARRGQTFVAAEEISCHEYQFCVGLDTASDGRPEAVDDQAGDTRHGAPMQAALRLPVIEEEVPRLVEGDALDEIAEHRMRLDGDEPPVSG